MQDDVLPFINSKSLDAAALPCVLGVADSNPDHGCLCLAGVGDTGPGLQNSGQATNLATATPLKRGPKGPVPKRRHQEGTFRKENGRYYSFFYRDRITPDGNARSVKERFDHGKVGEVSELSARREHDRLRQKINRERGSIPTGPKGETFKDAADAYIESIAPHLSCSTVRQRQSHLRFHLLPRFGAAVLMALDIRTLQRFATEMLEANSRKTILNVLGTFFAILDYARKCGMRVPETTLSALTITADRGETETPYFRPDDAARIIAGAKEPYRTIFALAWCTGLRAGELLGLTRNDLDFERKLIIPRKQADDSTRQLRELKTKRSKSPVAMTPEVEAMLANYLRQVWQENPSGLLFPNRNGRPRKRQYVVKFGLKPLLGKLGLAAKDVGLHAFRHGLGTALSNSKVSPKTVQQILRHTDIKTTFRYYVHSDTDAQRNALAAISIGTTVLIGTENQG
jgi:integrase